jgi:hypothetical protein
MAFRTFLSLASLLAVAWLCAPVAASAQSMRCDASWVSPGKSSYDVRVRCGEPNAANQRVEARTVTRVVEVPCMRRHGPGLCQVMLQDVVSVVVEEWTYDFGPQRLVQYLRFEQGQLVQVESGNYGHDRT